MIDKIDILTSKISKDIITVEDGLCTKQRNVESACNLCVDVCPVDAITMEEVKGRGITPTIDFNKCNLCGACFAVCPDGVFELGDESIDRIVKYSGAVMATTKQMCVECDLGDILSSEVAELDEKAMQAKAKQLTQDRKNRPKEVVYVPCLARINESVLAGIAGSGVEQINLLSSKCKTCSINSVVPTIESSISNANRFFDIYGASTKINFMEEFPDGALLGAGSGKKSDDVIDYETFDKESRRSFLKNAKTSAISVGADVAHDSLPEFFSIQSDVDEGLIYKLPHGRRILLDGIAKMKDPSNEAEPVGSLPLYSLEINSKCTGCTWCAMYCPTKALSLGKDENLAVINFTVAHCTACNVCIEVCYAKAIDKRDIFSPADFRSESLEELIAKKSYFCADCKQEFMSSEYSERCMFCEKKHVIFGEMDGDFLWDTDVKPDL